MAALSKLQRRWLKRLLAPTTARSQPNHHELAKAVNNLRLVELNVKAMGYEMARTLAAALPPPAGTAPRDIGLHSKASTQADIESDWVAHWAGQLHVPVVYHRKLWELAYVLQAIHEHGHLRAGARGLGFGCGVEPHPSFLAAHGVSVTITDLDPDAAKAQGWISTNQHAASLEQAFQPHLVSRELFDRNVTFQVADMNDIPDGLRDYDFCWSMCAVEHLGSIDKGLTFLREVLKTLRPGGLSVHTLEFNVEDGATVDNWTTVLFQRRHIEALATRLRAEGHEVARLDFNYGSGPMDNFIDVPPYPFDNDHDPTALIGHPLHLKLGIDGFIATCFGLIVRRAG